MSYKALLTKQVTANQEKATTVQQKKISKKVIEGLRYDLKRALEKSGKFSEVIVQMDYRGNKKLYLSVRGVKVDADLVCDIAAKAGLEVIVRMTSGSATSKRYRVEHLIKIKEDEKPAEKTLFDAVKDSLASQAVQSAHPVTTTVVIGIDRFNNVPSTVAEEIRKRLMAYTVQDVEAISAQSFKKVTIRVPSLIAAAWMNRKPESQSGFTVTCSQGLTIMSTPSGNKYFRQ